MNELVLPLLLLIAGLSVLGVVLLARWFEGRSWYRSITSFRLRLPADVSADAVAGWLSAINAATHAPLFSLLPAPPVALEVVASQRGIEHVLLVPRTMQQVVLASVRACLPGVRIDELPAYLDNRPRFRAAAEGAVSSHTRPLGAERAEVASSALLAAMQPLHGTERVVVQWIITGGGIPRPVPSVAAKRQDNGWFFDGRMLGDAEAVRAERLKQKEPLLRACVRVALRHQIEHGRTASTARPGRRSGFLTRRVSVWCGVGGCRPAWCRSGCAR